jgi:hypothetical protein
MSFFFSLLMAIVIASGSIEASPDNRPYQPIGAALTAFYSRAPEVLLAGAAGTGKIRSILEKLHLCASKYAGMRGVARLTALRARNFARCLSRRTRDAAGATGAAAALFCRVFCEVRR